MVVLQGELRPGRMNEQNATSGNGRVSIKKFKGALLKRHFHANQIADEISIAVGC